MEVTHLWPLLGTEMPREGGEIVLLGLPYILRDGVLRLRAAASDSQEQTRDAFGYKWAKHDTYASEAMHRANREWLLSRYGDVAELLAGLPGRPLFLDAGCGAAYSTLLLFPPEFLARTRYVGVDISSAVDEAAQRFSQKGLPGEFMQADIGRLPFPESSLDVVFSEGVMHHTDSTEHTLKHLAKLLRPGGLFLFYVYRRKGPIREFTDDFIRARLQGLPPAEAWELLRPLTALGKQLGEMDSVIEVPEDISLLDIPAGPIPLQRFIYWHVFKAFYRPDMTLEEMLHINFDWYAPRNAHRQSPEEVRQWCAEAGLDIQRETIEPAGITVVARKAAAPRAGQPGGSNDAG